jgi:hypothetical protein
MSMLFFFSSDDNSILMFEKMDRTHWGEIREVYGPFLHSKSPHPDHPQHFENHAFFLDDGSSLNGTNTVYMGDGCPRLGGPAFPGGTDVIEIIGDDASSEGCDDFTKVSSR